MNNRYIVLAAKVISALFTPFYMPTVVFVVLLTFTQMRSLPFSQKLSMLLMIYIFTVLFPRVIIYFYRKQNGWTSRQLSTRTRRAVPYVISIVCYTVLLIIMNLLKLPTFTFPIVAAALLIQIICAVLNSVIKVSTHAAASGGIIGMLIAFSIDFDFNAVGWIAICVMLCGCVCSARMVLRQHTYKELLTGVIVGVLSGWSAVIAGSILAF